MKRMSGVFQSLWGQSTFRTLGFLVTAAQLTWRYGQSLVDDQSALLIVFVYMNLEVLVVRHAEESSTRANALQKKNAVRPKKCPQLITLITNVETCNSDTWKDVLVPLTGIKRSL